MSFFTGLFSSGSEEEKEKVKAFKTTMGAVEKTGVPGIRRAISNPLPSEGSKQSLSTMIQEHKQGDLKIHGQTASERGGGKKRRKSRRKKRRKSRHKRKKSRRKKRRKSRRKKRR